MENVHSRNYGKGLAAGFVATVMLSAIMLIKGAMGLMPQLDVIGMLSSMLGNSHAAGWLAHFVIGTIAWGLLFTAIFGAAPDGFWWRGMVFAIGAWLLMMIVVMPIAGAGLFGASLGIMAPVMTFVLHVIYGWVLGGAYGVMLRHEPHPVGAH